MGSGPVEHWLSFPVLSLCGVVLGLLRFFAEWWWGAKGCFWEFVGLEWTVVGMGW